MIKKFLWLTAGFGAGLSSSIWVKRVVKKQVNRYAGPVNSNFVASSIKATKTTVDNATQEGKKIVGKYRGRTYTNADDKLSGTLLIVNE